MSKLTEVLKLLCYDPETDGNLTFNVTEALTKNWEKIDQLVLLAVAAAGAYDPEGSYAVGDYCTHGGKLHKCGTAIPDGEEWNAEHWTVTTVAAELAEVHSLLSPLGGATTVQAALAALGAGVQDNDLINPFFEVNQRGVTEWTGGYGVDCWTNTENKDTAKITVGSDGEITLTSTTTGVELGCVFSQILEKTPNPGEKYTLSFFGSVLSGNVYLALSNDTNQDYEVTKLLSPSTDSIFEYTAEIPSTWKNTDRVRYAIYQTGPGTVKIKAAKKEPGDKQTLGYKDAAGVWHRLPQPESDYASQLAKCKRCLRIFNQWFKMRASYIGENRVVFTIPGDMRINPTVDGSWGVFQFNQFSPETGFSFAAYNSGDSISFECTKNNHGLTDAWLGVLDDGNAKLVAEL